MLTSTKHHKTSKPKISKVIFYPKVSVKSLQVIIIQSTLPLMHKYNVKYKKKYLNDFHFLFSNKIVQNYWTAIKIRHYHIPDTFCERNLGNLVYALQCIVLYWIKSIKCYKHSNRKRNKKFKYICRMPMCSCTKLIQWTNTVFSKTNDFPFEQTTESMLEICEV